MSKVQIIDHNTNQEGEPAQPVSFGGNHAASRVASSQLTTLHEQPNEHMTTSGTNLCTAEAMHLAVEDFAEHIVTRQLRSFFSKGFVAQDAA